jgi:UPF0716 protein FxsA
LFPVLLALLILPLIEIAGFVLVGSHTGVLPTIALVILTGMAGGLLLRWQGLGTLDRIRRQLQAGRDPSRELAHAVMIVFAGILLLIPGFFTDIIGLLLFIPPVRDLGWSLIRDRITIIGDFKAEGWRPSSPDATSRGKTIDLDTEEYSRDPDKTSPWRRIDRN